MNGEKYGSSYTVLWINNVLFIFSSSKEYKKVSEDHVEPFVQGTFTHAHTFSRTPWVTKKN